MLWFYGHLETFVLGVFAFGILLHFVRRRGERQRYIELRAAYEDAVREARQSDGYPAAVVREAELRRTIMNSEMPGWFQGFGRCAARWLKYSAAAALLLLFLRGPILQGEASYAGRHAGAATSLRPPGGKVPSR